MVGYILGCHMKPNIVQYSPSYFGVTFNKKQLRLLRRIASVRAEPVGFMIRACIRKGFAQLEHYTFAQGD